MSLWPEAKLSSDRILIVTTAEDADHFTRGLWDVLERRGASLELWCFWLEKTTVDFPQFKFVSEVVAEYSKGRGEKFDRTILSQSVLDDPSELRTITSRIKAAGLDFGPITTVSGISALDYENSIDQIFPYLSDETNYMSAEVDRDRTWISQFSGSSNMGFSDPDELLESEPDLVELVKERRLNPDQMPRP